MLLPEYAEESRGRSVCARLRHKWLTIAGQLRRAAAASGKDGAASGNGPSPRRFRNRLPSPDSPHLLSPLN